LVYISAGRAGRLGVTFDAGIFPIPDELKTGVCGPLGR